MNTTVENKSVSICIGSWGSYNACNEKSLGSGWIDLGQYSEWEEIEDVLIGRGFDLFGIDEELFIQDIDNFDADDLNWDYVHPKNLFETLKESGILDNTYLFEVMEAYLEVRSYREWKELVETRGCNWNDDVFLYPGYDWEDYGREMVELLEITIPERLEDCIDYERYARLYCDCAEEYSGGIIEIY